MNDAELIELCAEVIELLHLKKNQERKFRGWSYRRQSSSSSSSSGSSVEEGDNKDEDEDEDKGEDEAEGREVSHDSLNAKETRDSKEEVVEQQADTNTIENFEGNEK